MSKMVRIAVGGTFDPLHDGHKTLLAKAFELGDEVIIGLTSDEMAEAKTMPRRDYESRRQNLLEHLESAKAGNFSIVKLHDPFGPTISEDFDYLVVSPETAANAEKINEIRKKNGMPIITVKVVDFVLAEDKQPISSTRIKNKEIDRHGHIILYNSI